MVRGFVNASGIGFTLPAACAGDAANCAFASASLQIATARWCDFNVDGSTNSADIALAADKVKPIPSAFTKQRMLVVPGLLKPHANINVVVLQNAVDAVKLLPQAGSITGPQSCP